MIPAFLENDAAATGARLQEIYPKGERTYSVLYEAQNYSLLAGGKRIRPALVLETCRMLGGDARVALDYAAAVEMVHTYSLIHDDLPCMDNDDLRRGRPTNHKVFGEDIATLAGDGLLTDAFAIILSCPYASAQSRADAALALSRGAGSFGMVKGQVIDMFGEKNTLTEQELLELHRGKTGALIEAAVRLGCHAAGLDENDPRLEALVTYAQNIGLAFQVMDDVLDCTQSAEIMGKSVGGDARDQKTTFMSFYDVQGAKAYAADLTARATDAIKELAGSENLIELANYLAKRSY